MIRRGTIDSHNGAIVVQVDADFRSVACSRPMALRAPVGHLVSANRIDVCATNVDQGTTSVASRSARQPHFHRRSPEAEDADDAAATHPSRAEPRLSEASASSKCWSPSSILAIGLLGPRRPATAHPARQPERRTNAAWRSSKHTRSWMRCVPIAPTRSTACSTSALTDAKPTGATFAETALARLARQSHDDARLGRLGRRRVQRQPLHDHGLPGMTRAAAAAARHSQSTHRCSCETPSTGGRVHAHRADDLDGARSRRHRRRPEHQCSPTSARIARSTAMSEIQESSRSAPS